MPLVWILKFTLSLTIPSISCTARPALYPFDLDNTCRCFIEGDYVLVNAEMWTIDFCLAVIFFLPPFIHFHLQNLPHSIHLAQDRLKRRKTRFIVYLFIFGEYWVKNLNFCFYIKFKSSPTIKEKHHLNRKTTKGSMTAHPQSKRTAIILPVKWLGVSFSSNNVRPRSHRSWYNTQLSDSSRNLRKHNKQGSETEWFMVITRASGTTKAKQCWRRTLQMNFEVAKKK